jgi:hypothetical protein
LLLLLPREGCSRFRLLPLPLLLLLLQLPLLMLLLMQLHSSNQRQDVNYSAARQNGVNCRMRAETGHDTLMRSHPAVLRGVSGSVLRWLSGNAGILGCRL